MEDLAIPTTRPPDLPHLAERQAFSDTENPFNLNQAVEARNMAVGQHYVVGYGLGSLHHSSAALVLVPMTT